MSEAKHKHIFGTRKDLSLPEPKKQPSSDAVIRDPRGMIFEMRNTLRAVNPAHVARCVLFYGCAYYIAEDGEAVPVQNHSQLRWLARYLKDGPTEDEVEHVKKHVEVACER